MEQVSVQQRSSSIKSFLFLWVISIISAVGIGYFVGVNNSTPASSQAIVFPTSSPALEATPALVPSVAQTTPATNVIQETPTPIVDINGICKKSGFAQKDEYLTPYTIKENDTFTNVAEKELHDVSRVNELIKLNANTSLTIGAILYLPPQSIKQSAGNLKKVSGMLVKKDNISWHISFGGGTSGTGVLIPTYWFLDIQNKDTYKIGDCLTILFDDEVKVFTVKRQ